MSCICNVGVRSLGKSESLSQPPRISKIFIFEMGQTRNCCVCRIYSAWWHSVGQIRFLCCAIWHMSSYFVSHLWLRVKKLCGSRWWLQHAQLLMTTQLNVSLHLEAAWSFRVLTSSGLYTFIDGWLTFDLISRSHVKKMLAWSCPSTVSFDTVKFKLVWYV